MLEIENKISKVAFSTDKFLNSYLREKSLKPTLLSAIKYGLFSGGKKFRSFILKNTAKIFNLNENEIIKVGAAVECMHSYSLIHDDLPCMDNDDIRRGKPSAHKVFGESTAILAGNSLLTLSFEILGSDILRLKKNIKSDLIFSLAKSAGYKGIAGGQYLDLAYERKKVGKNKIIDMQNKKTGKLMGFCCEAAAIIANKNKDRKLLRDIGLDIGLLFQITDDLLDIYGDKGKIGKPTKQDLKKGKATLIREIGVNKTIEFAYALSDKIIRILKKKYGTKANDLIDSVEFLLTRDR